jgi:hypothetical protein
MRSSADASILASALLCVAAYHAAAGEIADADAAAREALGLTATRAPDGIDVPIGIELLALVYALRGNLARAATLEGYADEVLQQNGVKREPTDATTHDRLDTILRTRLTPDQLQRLMEEGAALTPDSALALALAP